jgi:hypothetical protein
MSSDQSMPHSNNAAQVYPQRSASALGAAGGYRQPVNGSRSVEHLRDGFAGHYKRNQLGAERVPLEPLSEDEALATPTGTIPSASSEQGKVRSDTDPRNPDVIVSDDRGEERSASVAQMRDLKDQMKDLKGRISSLREQAQADSLKRRSLHSLRTPSPFTHARIDQWYAEPKLPSEAVGAAQKEPARNPWNGELSTVDGDSQAGVREDAEEGAEEEEVDDEVVPVDVTAQRANRVSFIRHPVSQQMDQAVLARAVVPEIGDASAENRADDDEDGSDMETENGDMEDGDHFEEAPTTVPPMTAEEAEDMSNEGFVDVIDDEEYVSESGESAYEDTLEQPISHEDREDAFDYEHFFLHSAMGTISQQRRRDSYSSEDSVETTRGPSAVTEGAEKGRTRRGSSASTSTFDSFATAEEGRSSRGGMQDENGTEEQAQNVRTATTIDGKRPDTAPNARRTVLGPIMGNGHALDSNTSLRDIVLRRPMSSAAAGSLHSVSSFESMGTTRSFPLVNKPAQTSSEATGGADGVSQASSGGRQQHHLPRSASVTSFDSVRQLGSEGAPAAAAAMQALAREDQYLVERLVANLGKCVLGLTEAGKASTESRMYRRRIDAARKILEGLNTTS